MTPSKLISLILLAMTCLLITSLLLPFQNPTKYDILFINGKVMDGTGNPSFYADVGVADAKIAAVGRLKDKVQATRVIDIKGKVITPGFIDIHSHAFDSTSEEGDWEGEEKRYAGPNYVSQGVTTLVSNQCGTSPLSIKKQREFLTKKGIGLNTLLLIGHNDVRQHVMKNDFERPATTDEINQMKAFIRQAMEDGAVGISSGLEYVPSIWSTTDEVVALVEEIVPFGGFFQAHERAAGLTPMWYVPSQDKPGPPSMLGNIVELIEIGKRTGAKIIATHIKARGVDFWGGSRAIIRLINDARAHDIDIWADAYPYNSSGSDGSVVLIPSWALGRNYQETLKSVLRDQSKKKDLFKDIKHAFNWRGNAENIIVMDYPDTSYIGKNIATLAEDNGITDIDMVIKLQLEGFANRRGGARLRSFSMSEIDIEAFYTQPWTATSTDGRIALPTDGPVHARYYGTFPRKIRHYAMDRKVLTVENAIRSSTSLPAQIIGLRDRGLIQKGYHADIVVFDPLNIRDTATFFEPHQYAEGIDFVLVNGIFVVENGDLTWEKPGIVITNPNMEK
ncbi:amidohydrolase family protein [Acidobacteriota bacterium]